MKRGIIVAKQAEAIRSGRYVKRNYICAVALTASPMPQHFL